MKKLAVLSAAIFLYAISAGVVSAQVSPPTIDNIEAYGFSNVLEDDDRLILVRYELPLADWQIDASTANPPFPTAFMVDATCTPSETINLKDPCYTSLLSGMVLHTFYDGVPGNPGVSQTGIRSVPRVGFGMSGIYISPGHGLAPPGAPSAAYQTCVEGSSTVFTLPTYSSRPVDCLHPIWLPLPAVGQSTDLATVLVSMGDIIESDMNQPVNSFVDMDVLTEIGSIMPKEAFSPMANAAPTAFYAAVTQPWRDFDLAVTPTALDTAVGSAAQSSRIYQAFDGAANQYFGTTPAVLGSIFFIVIAVTVVMAVTMVTNSVTYGSMLGMLVLVAAMFTGVLPIAALWVLLAILLLLGGTYVFRRFPQ